MPQSNNAVCHIYQQEMETPPNKNTIHQVIDSRKYLSLSQPGMFRSLYVTELKKILAIYYSIECLSRSREQTRDGSRFFLAYSPVVMPEPPHLATVKTGQRSLRNSGTKHVILMEGLRGPSSTNANERL